MQPTGDDRRCSAAAVAAAPRCPTAFRPAAHPLRAWSGVVLGHRVAHRASQVVVGLQAGQLLGGPLGLLSDVHAAGGRRADRSLQAWRPGQRALPERSTWVGWRRPLCTPPRPSAVSCSWWQQLLVSSPSSCSAVLMIKGSHRAVVTPASCCVFRHARAMAMRPMLRKWSV